MHLSPLKCSSRCRKYRRSGNFRVKCISPLNFSRCFIFVAQAQQRKLNHAKILFTCTCTCAHSRDRIPCRAIGEELERQISASEGMHPCRIVGTAIGYLRQKISPVCLGLRFQLPSEVRFHDHTLGLVWKSSAIFQDREHHRQVSGSAAEPYLHFNS